MGNTFGRTRTAQNYEVHVHVNEINQCTLGKELLRRCGNEGRHHWLDEVGQTTLKFLRAAISFVPDARGDGVDLSNACFILNQPVGAFVIKSGNGDWEFKFSQDDRGNICGTCKRQPLRRYLWDGFKSVVKCVGKVVFKAVVSTGVTLAITAAAVAAAPFLGPVGPVLVAATTLYLTADSLAIGAVATAVAPLLGPTVGPVVLTASSYLTEDKLLALTI